VIETVARRDGRKGETGGSGFANLVQRQSALPKPPLARAESEAAAADHTGTSATPVAMAEQDDKQAAMADRWAPRRAQVAHAVAGGSRLDADKAVATNSLPEPTDSLAALQPRPGEAVLAGKDMTSPTAGALVSDPAAGAGPAASWQATPRWIPLPQPILPADGIPAPTEQETSQPASAKKQAKPVPATTPQAQPANKDVDRVVETPEPAFATSPKESGLHAEERKTPPKAQAHTVTDLAEKDAASAAAQLVEYRAVLTEIQPQDAPQPDTPAKLIDAGPEAPVATTPQASLQAEPMQSEATDVSAATPLASAATPAANSPAPAPATLPDIAPMPAADAASATTTKLAKLPEPTANTPAMPQTFRAELTVAAANYAIQTAKAQPEEPAAPPASTDGAEADTTQPVRITVLGASTRTAPPTPFAPAQPPIQGPFSPVAPQDSASMRSLDTDDRGKVARQVADDRQSPVATVSSAQRLGAAETALLPSAGPAGSTPAAAVTATIAQEVSWRPAHVADPSQMSRQAFVQEAKTLSIQLHPAELGVVTATLRLSGEQLHVELSAESETARHRLSVDSDEIVRSLRRLGLDIDQVQIMQLPAASSSLPRSDDSAFQGMLPQRGQNFADSGASGGGGHRLADQQSGRKADEGTTQPQQNLAKTADRSGSLYI